METLKFFWAHNLPPAVKITATGSEVYCEDERCAHNSHDAGASWSEVQGRRLAQFTYQDGYGHNQVIAEIVAFEFEDLPGQVFVFAVYPYRNGISPCEYVSHMPDEEIEDDDSDWAYALNQMVEWLRRNRHEFNYTSTAPAGYW